MSLLPAAIGIILNKKQTHILLVKRCDVPVWVLPGGGVEGNESPEQTVKREIEEETGYQVRILRKCAEYSPINRLAAFTSVFICHIESGQKLLSQETADVAFHSIHALPTSFFPLHRIWLKEALSHSGLIRRSLTEVSYYSLCKYFMSHPWQVLRFSWTRFISTRSS
jgi:8-oxo-dGTP diphosphatase